jgi:hypothetical protein
MISPLPVISCRFHLRNGGGFFWNVPGANTGKDSPPRALVPAASSLRGSPAAAAPPSSGPPKNIDWPEYVSLSDGSVDDDEGAAFVGAGAAGLLRLRAALNGSRSPPGFAKKGGALAAGCSAPPPPPPGLAVAGAGATDTYRPASWSHTTDALRFSRTYDVADWNIGLDILVAGGTGGGGRGIAASGAAFTGGGGRGGTLCAAGNGGGASLWRRTGLLITLLPLCSYSSWLATLCAHELGREDALLLCSLAAALTLLLTLPLPLELRSPASWPPRWRASTGRRTEEDARALAAAFMASLVSSLASFHALIFTCFLALFALSAFPAVSGSMVDGTIPASRCGITSSCIAIIQKRNSTALLPPFHFRRRLCFNQSQTVLSLIKFVKKLVTFSTQD